MAWPLIPLILGAISFGWYGGSLLGLLAPVLGGTAEKTRPLTLISPLGVLAFALGLGGFLFQWWYTRRLAAPVPGAEAPASAAAGWVSAIARAGYAVTHALQRIQSGQLPRYAFGSFVALAVITLLRVVAR